VTPDRSTSVALGRPLDLVTTLAPLRHGRGDRTIQIAGDEAWLAVRTLEGAASLRLALHDARELRADAWGPGAGAVVGIAARLVGEDDDPDALVCRHPILRELQRRNPGLRLPSSGRVLHALVPTILEQKVTGTEAFRSYAALLRRYGEPAPGPAPALLLPPTPATLAALPYHAFHPLGVERRRAEVIRAAAARSDWLEGRTAAETARRLRSIPGIGAWTVAEVLRCVFGDPDAVSVGDYHVPNMVAWALAGEARADDARMLELLAPYRGQRGRVQRLLEVGRVTAPRYGSRMAPRSIATI
jgi:3-methyladenine DNA glycosylase/8-oxoguanine DNA glycosylase